MIFHMQEGNSISTNLSKSPGFVEQPPDQCNRVISLCLETAFNYSTYSHNLKCLRP